MLGLTDSQYSAICRACERLQPQERSALLTKLTCWRLKTCVGQIQLQRALSI